VRQAAMLNASIDVSSLEFQLIPIEYSWKSTGDMLQGELP
jgi:hypothetical protein